MENLIIEYLLGRKSAIKETVIHPIITISRSHGCNSNLLTNMLIENLNRKQSRIAQPIQVINKPVIKRVNIPFYRRSIRCLNKES